MPPCVLVCPLCKSTLPNSLSCNACGRDYSYRNGIYRFLLGERHEALQPFVSQYRLIRKADGYRSRSAEYYRSLPHTGPRDPQAQTWRVRAETFEHLLQQVLGDAGRTAANTFAASGAPGCTRRPAPGSTSGFAVLESGRNSDSLGVLDLGAGNGWLSHRLAMLGHQCVAVDCNDDAEDGLGAFVHYGTPIDCVQADFDQLPFAPHQFDAVIFNASLHYSSDIQTTLHHAYNMLLPGGASVVMDSPTFWSATSGQLMRRELATHLQAQTGMAQLVMPGVGYISADAFIEAGRKLDIQFRFIPSHGSVGWAVRRLLAGIKRRREPASFGLWYGRI